MTTYAPPLSAAEQQRLAQRNRGRVLEGGADWRMCIDDIAWEHRTLGSDIPFSGDVRLLIKQASQDAGT